MTRSSGGQNNETPQDVRLLCNRPTFWPAGSHQEDVIGNHDPTTRLLGESYNPASNSSTPRTQTRSRSKVKEFFCHKSLDGWQARASRDVSLSSSSGREETTTVSLTTSSLYKKQPDTDLPHLAAGIYFNAFKTASCPICALVLQAQSSRAWTPRTLPVRLLSQSRRRPA